MDRESGSFRLGDSVSDAGDRTGEPNGCGELTCLVAKPCRPPIVEARLCLLPLDLVVRSCAPRSISLCAPID